MIRNGSGQAGKGVAIDAERGLPAARRRNDGAKSSPDQQPAFCFNTQGQLFLIQS